MSWYVLAAAITIDDTNDELHFKEDGGSTLVAALTHGTFALYADGSETGNIDTSPDSGDFAANVEAALIAAGAKTYSVAYRGSVDDSGVTGTVTITANSGTVQIMATSTLPLTILGFPQANTSASLVLTSSRSPSHTWVADQPPQRVDRGIRRAVRHQHVSANNSRSTFTASDDDKLRELAWDHVAGRRALEDKAAAFSDEAASFERFWADVLASGTRFRVYSVGLSSGTTLELINYDDNYLGTYVLDGESIGEFAPARTRMGLDIFGWSVLAAEYVA